MNSTFNNNHRYCIQLILNNGIVSLDDALTFLKKISPNEHSPTFLKSLIAEINREISKHSFKIASAVCEVTGEKVLVWLNTKNDDISRLQIGFSAVELEYFNAVMQEIVTSEDHSITYPRAINISSTLTAALSRENGEKALLKWISGGYYVKKDEHVYLGQRTILEFTTYLRTNTDNCICSLCSELVFVGETCPSCKKTFHSSCIQKYLQNQHSCPSCKLEWGTDDQSAESSIDSDPGPSQRKRRHQ